MPLRLLTNELARSDSNAEMLNRVMKVLTLRLSQPYKPMSRLLRLFEGCLISTVKGPILGAVYGEANLQIFLHAIVKSG